MSAVTGRLAQMVTHSAAMRQAVNLARLRIMMLWLLLRCCGKIYQSPTTLPSGKGAFLFLSGAVAEYDVAGAAMQHRIQPVYGHDAARQLRGA